MDIVNLCLAIVPLPYLSRAFTRFRFIWTSVQQAQASQEQLKTLAYALAQLLRALDMQYREGKLLQNKTSEALNDLQM